jgi:hypothetical protein
MKDVTAHFELPNGNPAAGARLTFLLSQDCIAADGSGQIGRYPIIVTLDANGDVATELQCNDEILPAGTTYHVSLADPTFGLIYRERLTIAGSSPINLNAIAPALE